MYSQPAHLMSQIGYNFVKLQCEIECVCYTLLKTTAKGPKLPIVLEKRASCVFRRLRVNGKSINQQLQNVQELNVERFNR